MTLENSNIVRFPSKKIRIKKTMSKKPEQAQELMKWYIKYRLRSGLEGCYPISTSEKEDLWERLPKVCEQKGLNFFEFESETHHILMQPSQLVFFQFLFEPLNNNASQDSEDEDMDEDVDEVMDSYSVKIYSTDSPNPMIFQVDVDQPDPNDEGDQGEMSNFIFYALHICEEEELLHLTDEDGETAFFRGSSIALVEIPLKVLQPEGLRLVKNNE